MKTLTAAERVNMRLKDRIGRDTPFYSLNSDP